MSTLPGRQILEAQTIIDTLGDEGRLLRQLERDPGDHIAGTQLEAMYRSNRDWEPLVRLLLDRAEIQDSMEAARTLSDVAEIYIRDIGDVEAGFVVLQTAFTRCPDSARLADHLCDLAGRLRRYEEVIDLFVVEAAKLKGRASAVASELWLRVAWLHLGSGSDIEAAAAALERVSDLQSAAAIAVIDQIEESAQTPALVELFAEICRKIGDEERLLRTLNRLLALLGGADGSQATHFEIASIQLLRGEIDAAEWHLVEAIRHDPTHTLATETLMELYKQRGEYLKAARLLEVCREATANPLDQVQLSFEAANIYASALDEQTKAVEMYEWALSVDPEHVGAGLPLAQRYHREERWTDLEPIVDMLVRRASALGDGAPDLGELCFMAGRCAAALGKLDKARRYFDSALSIRSDHAGALVGLGDVLMKQNAWDEAWATLSAVLHIREQADDQEGAAAVLLQLGQCAVKSGDGRAAREAYRRALRFEPGCLDAMAALGDLYVKEGDYERAVEMMRAELGVADAKRRVRLLAEIGKITSRSLRDPARAITIFQQALEIDDSDREILHQLVEHYSAAGWWEDAVEAILRIVELEENMLRRGKYLQAAAVIMKNEIGNPARSADLYDDALDCLFTREVEMPEGLRPSCIKAFKDLGKMLSKAQMWKRLEQSYRRMIHRIDPEDEIAADLWHGLGEIYRLHLHHNESAIGSFEIASALDDKRLTRHRILVDLYEQAGPEKALEAIGRRHRLLQEEPLEFEHYKALRKLYARTKQYDRAWTACRVLTFLGRADDEERAFFDSRLPRGYDWPPGRITDETLRFVRDPLENSHITAILGMVAEEAALVSATPKKQMGLNPNVPGTPEFTNLVHTIGDVLDVANPEVYIHPGAPGEVLWANVCQKKDLVRTVAVGRDLYQGRDARYMVASIAKALWYSRPAYFLRMAASTPQELEAVFLAAASLSRMDVPVPAALAGQVGVYRDQLHSRLPSAVKQALADAVDRYVAAGEPYDLLEWCHRVDMGSRRAALLVSGDLELSVAVGGTQLDPIDTQEIVRYSVGDGHYSARQRLGLARD